MVAIVFSHEKSGEGGRSFCDALRSHFGGWMADLQIPCLDKFYLLEFGVLYLYTVDVKKCKIVKKDLVWDLSKKEES